LKIDLTRGKETAKDILGKATEPIKAITAVLGKLFAEKAAPLASRLRQAFASIQFTGEKKRLMFFAVGGLAALLLVLVIAAAALSSQGPRERAPELSIHAIPPEELFIPAEPDFVPDFLLEREPRHFWSIEDIRPYWRTPANPDFWQEVVRSAVDELMENVP